MSGTTEHGKDDLRRTVREVIRVVLFRRWAFLIPFCVACSGVFIASHRLPRVYKAETVFERRSTIPISNVLAPTGPESIAALRESMDEDMFGTEAMCRVADRLGLTKHLPRDKAGDMSPPSLAARRGIAQGLRGYISSEIIESLTDRDKVQIVATGDDPRLLVKLSNAVRDEYIHSIRLKYLGRIREASDFYQGEIDARLELIDQFELQMFELQNDFPYVEPHRRFQVSQDLMMSRTQRDNLLRRVEEYESKVRVLEGRLETMPEPRLISAHSLSSVELLDTKAAQEAERRRLKASILGLQNRIETLRVERGMLDTHPEIQKLQRKDLFARHELAELNRTLGEAPEEHWTDDPVEAMVEKTTRQTLLVELATARDALGSARQSLADVEARVSDQETVRDVSLSRMPEYRRLEDDLEKVESALQEDRKHQRELARVLEIDAKDQGIEFLTLAKAGISRRPVLPKSQTVVLLALGLGVACGACAVFLREFFDHTFRTSTAVSYALGVPVLEGIDEIVLPADRRRMLIRRIVALPVASLLIGFTTVSGGLAWLSIEDPPAYEQLVNRAQDTWGDSGTEGL